MRDAGIPLERIGAAFERAKELAHSDDITAYITISGEEAAFVDQSGLTSLLNRPGQGILSVLGVEGEITRLNETIRGVHPHAHVNPDGIDQQLLPFAEPSSDGPSALAAAAPAKAGQQQLL